LPTHTHCSNTPALNKKALMARVDEIKEFMKKCGIGYAIDGKGELETNCDAHFAFTPKSSFFNLTNIKVVKLCDKLDIRDVFDEFNVDWFLWNCRPIFIGYEDTWGYREDFIDIPEELDETKPYVEIKYRDGCSMWNAEGDEMTCNCWDDEYTIKKRPIPKNLDFKRYIGYLKNRYTSVGFSYKLHNITEEFINKQTNKRGEFMKNYYLPRY